MAADSGMHARMRGDMAAIAGDVDHRLNAETHILRVKLLPRLLSGLLLAHCGGLVSKARPCISGSFAWTQGAHGCPVKLDRRQLLGMLRLAAASLAPCPSECPHLSPAFASLKDFEVMDDRAPPLRLVFSDELGQLKGMRVCVEDPSRLKQYFAGGR